MILNFFFDVDGTILPFGKSVPKSAVEAFDQVHKLGHRLFFATGRGTAEITDALKSLPFDGGVFSAGGTIIYKGKTIYERRFSPDEKEYILEYSKKNNLELVVQTEDGTYLTPSACAIWESSLNEYIGGTIDVPNLVVVEKLPEDMVINKLLIFSKDHKIDFIREDIDKRFTVVGNTLGLPQSLMAEVVLSELTKATGMQKMIDYLGDDLSSTVALGDGPNDIEMIEYASLGIAMGNGCSDLKEKADYITDDVEQDGLRNALMYAIMVKS